MSRGGNAKRDGAVGAEDVHSPSPIKHSVGQEKNGVRPGKKQMAYVGAIYTQARFPRTAEDVIDEVRRRKRAKDRPEPQHKHVSGLG